MSALESRNSKSLAGLTLDAVLGGETLPQLPPQEKHTNRTLLDVIKEENNNKEFGHKDKKTWKTFRDKLRLKRTGSAWTSSVYIPTSDIAILKNNHHHQENHRLHHCESLRSQSVGVIHETTNYRPDLIESIPISDPPVSSGRPMFTRGSSMRVAATDDLANATMPSDGPPSRSFKPQMGRHNSIQHHGDNEGEHRRRQPVVTFAEERTLSAREAVAAQEASEAEAAAAAADKEDGDEEDGEKENSDETVDRVATAAAPASAQQPVMSLMDLLEDYDDFDDEEEEESAGDNGDDDEGGVGEFNCCICMVKIKGAAFIPCGHTFCRMCSRELMVQKGHCPACSSFVLEFLEIF